MPARERERAAQFEASRLVSLPRAEQWVLTRPIDQRAGSYALGIVRRRRLSSLMAVTRAAGLRLVAVDHESFALKRSFPNADAVLDIGHDTARLYVFGSATPLGATIEGGAQEFTMAIARALSVDRETAERRKRTIGLGGSASEELHRFAHLVGRALLVSRAQSVGDVQSLVLVGNGARLPGLALRLERDTGCSVEVAASLHVERSSYPPDVVRASAPDWSLSVGLALWPTGSVGAS
jgi:Tfp pilus assembly PilM family ATPase